MVKSRSDFLDKGYYVHLLEKLCESVYEVISENDVILDAGCGEGYYTSGIYNYLRERGMTVQSALELIFPNMQLTRRLKDVMILSMLWEVFFTFLFRIHQAIFY